MYKKFYSQFLQAHPHTLHMACHSHHYWPDVTREAQMQYWSDSCEYVDDKWGYFFAHKIPLAQKLIAQNLGLKHAQQIVFASNTHELSYRLLTCLDPRKKNKILTTDSEFYSFERQINRLLEEGHWDVTKVSTSPFANFTQRFCEQIQKEKWDMIFFSHVFFNSGLACDLQKILSVACEQNTLVVVDGYHGFMALPTDLSNFEDHIFYLSGSYKYAQGGEGCCFMTVPRKARLRPTYTGWFAEIAHLEKVDGSVPYPTDQMQMAGSTMDFAALYRLIASLELFAREQLSVEKIHAHIQFCQKSFLKMLDEVQCPQLGKHNLLVDDLNHHGHFLTFEMKNLDECKNMSSYLKQKGVKTDSRGSRLRFGFGLYHDGDYNQLKQALLTL